VPVKTVLLIEDDSDLRQLLSKFLEDSDFDVVEAECFKTATEHLESSNTFAAALVDFWIGTDSAVPLLDMIRDKFPEMPVVLISGGGGNVTLETTRAVGEVSGALQFLQKPFKKAELIQVLTDLT
jgi:DNA-binding NtrC family response regulator